MAKKKSRKIPNSTVANVDEDMPIPTAPKVNEDVDFRPETSVFTAPIRTFQTNDGSQFNIPSPLLEECPRLADQVPDCWGIEPKLDITLPVGHILVNYLFTKRYEHVKPEGSSTNERLIAEFATNIRVYAFARQLEFTSLQDHATSEIQRVGKLLPFVTIIDQVRIAYPQIPVDDLWIIDYLKVGIKSLAEGQSVLPKHNTLSVSDVLLQGFIDSHISDTSSSRQSPEATAFTSQNSVKLIMPQATEPAQKLNTEGSLMEHRLRAENEPEPPAKDGRPESDNKFEGRLVKNKTNKAKSGSFLNDSETEPALEAEELVVDEPAQVADDFWASFGYEKKKAKMIPNLMAEPEFENPVIEEATTFDDAGGNEQPTCPLRSEHVFGDGWSECTNCQYFIFQLSKKIATGETKT